MMLLNSVTSNPDPKNDLPISDLVLNKWLKLSEQTAANSNVI